MRASRAARAPESRHRCRRPSKLRACASDLCSYAHKNGILVSRGWSRRTSRLTTQTGPDLTKAQPMSDFLESLSSDVITGIVALPAGYYTRAGVDKLRDRLRARDVVDLFGLRTGPVTIVHSVIYDDRRNAYNFPSSDSKASRIVAQLFDNANRQEGKDFFIVPESEIRIGQQVDPRIWQKNLVLLCGPKRNTAVAEALEKLPPSLSYTMRPIQRSFCRSTVRRRLRSSGRRCAGVSCSRSA
jgi:hypothetical protein